MDRDCPRSLCHLSGICVVLERIVKYLTDPDLLNLVNSSPKVFQMFDQIPSSVWLKRAAQNGEYIFRQLADKYKPICLRSYINLLSKYNKLLKGFGEIEKVIDFTSGKIYLL